MSVANECGSVAATLLARSTRSARAHQNIIISKKFNRVEEYFIQLIRLYRQKLASSFTLLILV